MILAGIIFPVIHAILTVSVLDFLEIQIVILRICLFFAMLVMIVFAFRYSVWAKAKGLLKARGDGHSKFSATKGVYETLIGYIPILLLIGVAAFCGYVFVASMPRPDVMGFTDWGWGLGYWLVIGGILVGFTYVIIKPVIKTLKSDHEPKQSRIKNQEPKERLQDITPSPTRPGKSIDRQELIQFISSNTAENVKCPACGSANPAGLRQCKFCGNPI